VKGGKVIMSRCCTKIERGDKVLIPIQGIVEFMALAHEVTVYGVLFKILGSERCLQARYDFDKVDMKEVILRLLPTYLAHRVIRVKVAHVGIASASDAQLELLLRI